MSGHVIDRARTLALSGKSHIRGRRLSRWLAAFLMLAMFGCKDLRTLSGRCQTTSA